MSVVQLDANGLLPEGTHDMTLKEIEQIFVLDVFSYGLDINHRKLLFSNYERVAMQLHQVGVIDQFIDGSFVTSKSRPNDIDGYFRVEEVYHYVTSILPELQKLDAVWNAIHPKDSGGLKDTYGLEIFPTFGDFPQPNFGVVAGTNIPCSPEVFFKQSRILDPSGNSCLPKGIVKVIV